jgi:hypothetical protein
MFGEESFASLFLKIQRLKILGSKPNSLKDMHHHLYK